MHDGILVHIDWMSHVKLDQDGAKSTNIGSICVTKSACEDLSYLIQCMVSYYKIMAV